MFSHKQEAESSSGVATVKQISRSGERIQVGIANESGSGTITLTAVTPTSGGAFRSIVSGTIDVSDPTDIYILGAVTSIKATSSNTGDTFRLVVAS